MKLSTQEQDLAALRGVIARQSVQLIGLLAVLALSLVTVLLMVGRERTVVTPPTLQKSFWVEGDQVSGSYLEQMAGWIATLILDVSPGNIDYNKTILLQYSAPDAHGAAGPCTTRRPRRPQATMPGRPGRRRRRMPRPQRSHSNAGCRRPQPPSARAPAEGR
jgi:conjugal transfer pilus assembly protein TraE